MTKKEFGRSIAFLLIVCLLLLALCEVFELSDVTNIPTRFRTFEDLNENTVDAVWVGTSGVDRYWIAAKAYEEYGMTVYPFASDGMPAWLFVNVIDEIYKYQEPELIILDMRAFRQADDDVSLLDVRVRRVLDALNFFSVNRFKIAFKAMDINRQINNEKFKFDLSYLLSYIKYHSMWADEEFSIAENTSRKRNPYLGFYMHELRTIATHKQEDVVFLNDYYEPLDPISEKALYELLDYAQQKRINLLFVNTPEVMDVVESGQVNTLTRILEEAGVDYVHYCEANENNGFLLIPDLDTERGFYNDNHVNYYGAETFTEVFAAYLDEHYDFVDHRGDESVSIHWDGVYQTLKDDIAALEAASITE